MLNHEPLRLADGEYRFACLVWDNEPLPSGQLVTLAAAALGWKKSTTYTVLKKLCERGVLQNSDGQVTSLIRREDVQQAESAAVVDKTFGGSLPRFVAAFLNSKPISEAEAAEIRAEAEDAARRAEDAKAELEGQQTALHTAQSQLEAALLDANSTLTAQQAAAQAQTTVTDAAKKAYEEATAALDAYVRAQSRRYTTAELRLTSLDFRCPLDSYGRITTQFGEADPWGIPHRGTDFAAPGGTPLYAIADGIVSAARAMNSYGNCVQVSHGTADDGCRYDSLYAHMSSIAVAEGTAVQRGDLLGYVGNTGNVYGAGGGYHLHLELRVNGSRTDPLGYVPSR